MTTPRKDFASHLLFLFALVLSGGLSLSARAAEELTSKEQNYLNESTATAEKFLELAVSGSKGDEKVKFARMLTRLKSGAINTSLVESDGLCSKERVGGFVYSLDGKPQGNDIYLCKKAMRLLNHDRKEGAQIVLHELAHLDGSSSECEATFTSMSAASLAGISPTINGYFEKCWPNGIQLAKRESQEPSGLKLASIGLNSASESDPIIRNSSVAFESRNRKAEPRTHHDGCESAQASMSAAAY